MEPEGSVTHWVETLKGGDRVAAQRLWDAYFRRLVSLARSRLRGVSRRVADEEDVALSAFDSFCRAAEGGRFPRLNDRDDLWQLLVVITVRKACDLAKHEGRIRRGAVESSRWQSCQIGWLSRSSKPIPLPNSPLRSPRSAGACSSSLAARRCARSHSGRWRDIPTRKSPDGSAASDSPLTGNSNQSARSGRASPRDEPEPIARWYGSPAAYSGRRQKRRYDLQRRPCVQAGRRPLVEADANVLLESVAGERVGTSWHPSLRKVSLPRKFSESRSSILTTRKRLRSVTKAAHARTHARLEGSGA